MKHLILLGILTIVYSISNAQSDDCSSATTLTINSSCIYTAGTSVGATQSIAGCIGNADDDVWYQFTAINSDVTITVQPSANYDAVFQVSGGTCGALISQACVDANFSGGIETIDLANLTIGSTYFIRVYDYYAGFGSGTFNICLNGVSISTTATSSSIDEPCQGYLLPPVNSECNFQTFSTVGATTTVTPGTPSSICENWQTGTSTYGTPTNGGFGTGTKDVWFKIVVPSNGKVVITAQPIQNKIVPNDTISDGVMALYSGSSCTSLTQIACSDDRNYPGGTNFDGLPFIEQTGLAPGDTLYLRYWNFGTTGSGIFGLCVSSPTNDNCASSIFMCDARGYKASTSASYTKDYPNNMAGNNQSLITYIDTTNGINTGGVFGTNLNGINGSSAGPFGYDVTIDNNSWLSFTASDTVAVLTATVSDCFNGSGIQIQAFSANNCTAFSPVSDFKEGNSSFTITAVGLTPDVDYYIMIDGFGGDVCNYTIVPQSGVRLPSITGISALCNGESTTLDVPYSTAPLFNYSWYIGSNMVGTDTLLNASNLTSTTTYTLVVDGLCGQKQTLTKTIDVYPSYSINNPQSICSGNSYSLNGHTYTTPGNYNDTLQSISGCDSIITTNLTTQNCSGIPAKCLEIESILVQPCVSTPATAGDNEMLRFKVGPNSINVADLIATWPNGAWNGLIQNSATASVTASLNSTVLNSCGVLLEPQGGILPSGSSVLLICSFSPGINDVSFDNLTDTLYVIYHNETGAIGHFANYVCCTPSLRTTILMDNGSGCSDSATYDRSLLISAGTSPGDFVDFSWPGNLVTTYYNHGCRAIIPPANADLSGVITINGTSVTQGIAELYQLLPDTIPLVFASTNINTDGTYLFSNIPAGQYLVRAIADSATYPFTIPTYADSTYRWDSSKVWTVNCNQAQNISIINLIPSSQPGATMSGFIWDDDTLSQRRPGEPIRGVGVVIHKNPNGGAQYRTVSDTSGFYTFGNVAVGNYDLYVEMPNGVMINTYNISVTDTAQAFFDLNFYVDSVKGTIDTTNRNNPDTLFPTQLKVFTNDWQTNIKVYPSPVTSVCMLSIISVESEELSVWAEDITGRVIISQKEYTTKKGENTFTISSFADKPSGMYILRVNSKNMNASVRVLKN